MLTDGAVKNLAYMGIVSRGFVNDFSVYAGYIAFTRDGSTDTYSDPLAHNVNQPGAAEGPGFRHQTYEPVPIGYAITPPDDDTDLSSSPVWAVDQAEWERLGGRTAGTTTADEVTLGELPVGKGVVRVVGALVPMPTEQYYHPFGLANYAVTYSGYQVLSERAAVGAAAARPDASRRGHHVHAARRSRPRSPRRCATSAAVAGDRRPGALHRQRDADRRRADDRLDPGRRLWHGVASCGASRSSRATAPIAVTADPADAIAEVSETNNSASAS